MTLHVVAVFRGLNLAAGALLQPGKDFVLSVLGMSDGGPFQLTGGLSLSRSAGSAPVGIFTGTLLRLSVSISARWL